MIDKQQVKFHFSKNASTYNQYANIQKEMKNNLIKFMLENNKHDIKIKNILEIGCGTGYLTHALNDLFPSAHITAVDIAPGMIAEIKSQFINKPVDFICGDIEEMQLNNTYDLIISNATFQWFNHMSLTIEKLHNSLNTNGMLCFSTFGEYTFCELNECFNKAKQSLAIKELIYSGQPFYSLNKLTTLCKNVIKTTANDEEALVESKETFEYEYFDNCKDFFYSIKKAGANNSNKNNRNSSPTFIKKVITLYDKNFREGNKVKATYHCLFLKISHMK